MLSLLLGPQALLDALFPLIPGPRAFSAALLSGETSLSMLSPPLLGHLTVSAAPTSSKDTCSGSAVLSLPLLQRQIVLAALSPPIQEHWGLLSTLSPPITGHRVVSAA